MKKSTILVAGVLLAPTVLPQNLIPRLLPPVAAQPDVNNGGKAANPANIQMGPGGGQNFRAMTPEQRLVALAARREAVVRSLLTQNGFNDAKVIAAVVAYLAVQDKARLPLVTQAQKLSDAVRDQALTDGQIGGLLNNLQVAVEDEKTRTQTSLQALDASIGYSRSPRLEALLTVGGIIGEEALYSGGQSLPGMGDPGGQGGPGGFGPPAGGGLGGHPGGMVPEDNAPGDLAGFGQKDGQRARADGDPPPPPPGG